MKIKKRIKELYKGNPHAKIESSIPMLPTMPRRVGMEIGENRKLFKDYNKDRAKNFKKERVDMQLKFNDVRLTPPDKTLEITSPTMIKDYSESKILPSIGMHSKKLSNVRSQPFLQVKNQKTLIDNDRRSISNIN